MKELFPIYLDLSWPVPNPPNIIRQTLTYLSTCLTFRCLCLEDRQRKRKAKTQKMKKKRGFAFVFDVYFTTENLQRAALRGVWLVDDDVIFVQSWSIPFERPQALSRS